MNSLYAAVLLVVVAASATAGGVIGGVGESSAVIAGPSGTIVRDGHGSHNLNTSPVLTQRFASHGIIGQGAVSQSALNYGAVGHGVVGHSALGYGAVGHGTVGHGSLGYGGAIAHTPLGYPVPAGSGLEGQYVHDLTEKLYDDGTYKPHVYGL